MKLGGFDLDFEVVEWGAMLLGYRSVPDAPTSKGVDVLNISLSYTDPSSMFRYWHRSSYSPTNQNWSHCWTPHPMAYCSRRSELSILPCATGYWQKRTRWSSTRRHGCGSLTTSIGGLCPPRSRASIQRRAGLRTSPASAWTNPASTAAIEQRSCSSGRSLR